MSALPSSRGTAKSGRAQSAPTAQPPIPVPPTQSSPLAAWLVVVLVVVLFSGGLFGYDQGVISGALAGIKSTFALSPILIEVVRSWVTLGALVGALAGGEIADRIGRKRTVLIAGGLFTLGAAVQAFAQESQSRSFTPPTIRGSSRSSMANNGGKADCACFNVAGPVIGGRAHLTNLP